MENNELGSFSLSKWKKRIPEETGKRWLRLQMDLRNSRGDGKENKAWKLFKGDSKDLDIMG